VDADDLRKGGLFDNWITSAMRCAYCQMIYSIGSDGKKTVRGYFYGDLFEPDRWRAYKP
jgi:hypothetical protein